MEEKSFKNHISLTTDYEIPFYEANPDLQTLIYFETKYKLVERSVTDICFICDITRSMHHNIDIVKKTLVDFISYVNEITNIYPRVAFIGFRDKTDKRQIERKDFCANPKEIADYINNNFKCTGGDDVCVDIITPLKEALNLDWKSDLVFVYLVIDSPAYGKRYHEPIYADDYLYDDEDKLLEKLMSHYKKNRMNLMILKCNNICDKMIEIRKVHYNFIGNKLTVITLPHNNE